MNQSTTISGNDSLSKLVNTTILTQENKAQMSDVMRIDQNTLKSQFLNDISVMSKARDYVNSGLYSSSMQQEKTNQYDMVLAQRRFLWKQEETLYREIEELKKSHQRYSQSTQQYGIKNQNLEMTLKNKFNDISQQLFQIQTQKAQIVNNFEKLQDNLVPSKSKLSNTGELVMQNNEYYRMLGAKLNQQEKKIDSMKLEYNDPKNNELIPFDQQIKKMSEQTFESQARMLYVGTKFEGNEQQKIQALSTLRKKIEEHIVKRGLGGVLLDMPFKTGLDQDQQSIHQREYNKTMLEIDELKQSYIEAGGTDPNYLIAVNNLQNHYQQTHPIGNPKAPNVEFMNLQERSGITANPIFEYLPETFKQDIYQLENEANALKQANDANPLANPKLMRQPVEVADSSLADENMLEYLRQQEAEIMLVYNQNAFHKEKLQEIHKLKHIYEKRYLEKKVQEQLAMKKMEDEVLNQRNKTQDKETYLKFIQREINTMPLFYDPDSGFIIRYDYVINLPICYDSIRIQFGMFDKGIDIPVAGTSTSQYSAIPDGINSNKCLINERQLLRDQKIDKNSYLYILMKGYSSEFGGGIVPMEIGWTIHQVFTEDNLLTGFFEVPFYNTTFSTEINKLPEVDQIKLGLRISQPGDQILDINNQIINQDSYIMQAIHEKNPDLVKIQMQFKFKSQRIFALPPEFIATQVNDSRLWKSQLPPNQFKLQSFNFLTDAQAMLKKDQEDYLARQNARYKPKRRFGARKDSSNKGTPSERSTSKLKTVSNFRKKLEASKQGKTPTSKTPGRTPGRTNSRPGTRTQGRQQTGSPKSSNKEQYLVFKLRGLTQIYTKGIQSLKMKIAIFTGNKLLEDDEKKPCITAMELEPDERGENFFKYTLSHQFKLNLRDFYEDEDEEDIYNTYIFIAFFKDSDQLFGWHAFQIFDKVEGGSFQVKSGIYYENLLAPPGQSPPFQMNRVRKLNVQLNYILMQDDDRIIQLPQIDNYILDQKLKTDEDNEVRKKIYIVQNPRWNGQLKLDFTRLKNFSSKVNFVLKLAIIQEDEIITDCIERQCVKIDHLELFEGTGKGEFIVNHTMILRVGSKYLQDIFPNSIKKLNYLFSFLISSEVVGVLKFPVFTSQANLNTGQFKLVVNEFTAAGTIGKATNKEVTVYIQEEPLNLRDVEETPTYAKQTKQQKTVAQGDKSKVLIIKLEQLTDYPGTQPVEHTVQIYNGNELAVDLDGSICASTSDQPYPPTKNSTVPIQENVCFKIAVNHLIDENANLDNFQVFISFPNLGWLSFQLFINGELNTEDVVAKLFGGEVQAPPVDYRNLKKINTRIQYTVSYDVKPNNGEISGNPSENLGSRRQVKPVSSRSQQIKQQTQIQQDSNQTITTRRKQEKKNPNQVTFKFVNINGFEAKTEFYIKMVIMAGRALLKDNNDQPCTFTSSKYMNINKTVFMPDVSYEFETDIAKVPYDTLYFIQVLNAENEIQGWYYGKLMRQTGAVQYERIFEKLLKPPVMKPPFDPNSVKQLSQTIQLEIL